MEHSDDNTIANRTGPLHHSLGLTAAATQDDVDAALSRLQPPADSVIAQVLGDPQLREKYEQLVYAQTMNTAIAMDEAHHDSLFRFARDTGFALVPVPGVDNTFSVYRSDEIDDSEDPARASRPTDSGERRVSTVRPRLTGDPAHPTAGPIHKSLAVQITAGVLLIGLLAGLAWMTAPKPAPPSAEESMRAELRESLRDASSELAALRDARNELDQLAKQLIGPTHEWHNVDDEPPPSSVAVWLRDRDPGDGSTVLQYNTIAAGRSALDIASLEAEHARLSGRIGGPSPERVAEGVTAFRDRVSLLISETESHTDLLRDLDSEP